MSPQYFLKLWVEYGDGKLTLQKGKILDKDSTKPQFLQGNLKTNHTGFEENSPEFYQPKRKSLR